jgi:hypothetical protein
VNFLVVSFGQRLFGFSRGTSLLTPQYELTPRRLIEGLGNKIGGRGRSRGLISALISRCREIAFGRSFCLALPREKRPLFRIEKTGFVIICSEVAILKRNPSTSADQLAESR